MNVLGLDEGDRVIVEQTIKEYPYNVVEKMLIDAAKSTKHNLCEKTKAYFPIILDVQKKFKEDFHFMLEVGMTSIEDFSNLLSVYYFYYMSQACVTLDQFCQGNRNVPVQLYYALDWEKVSKNRKCCIEGWERIQENVNHMFSHAVTLEIINQHTIQDTMFDYIALQEYISQNPNQDDIIAKEIEKAEQVYTSCVGDYKKFDQIKYTSGGSKTDVAVRHLYKCVEAQFLNTDRKRPNQVYNEKFIDFCKARWIKNRHKSGLVLNLTERDIIFLTKISIKRKDKIRLIVIDNIYRIAIKYGCILEKFDDISFKREEVVSVNLNTIPFFELKITDWSLERRQIFSSSYYSTRARKNGYKRSYENDIIYNYYKCYICKKMTILNVDSEVEYFIQSMLERQFAGENMFHLLVRYASLPDYKLADLASYSYSVYLLLYIELLILLFVDKKIYKICNLKDIKKNMFGANIISDEEFEQTIKICFPEEQGKSLKTEFYKIENGIVLGCWMFNSDLLIIEKVNDLVFNIKQNVMLGKDVDTFGKKILEKIVKEIANRNDWKTVKSNIQIKSTDFDLIAFKEGNVILGQVKASHTTRKPYSLWKANEVILDANRQILRCKKAIEEDKYLLYSNLKREKIISRREEIKNVIFIVICGNSYLNGNGEIPVVGIEDWNNLLKIDAGKPEFYKFLECPSMMYKLDDIPEYKESIIETEEYVLLYNELE